MKLYSHFIKLPGERVLQSQIDAGIPNPETYPADFWIQRESIQAVMEVKEEKTGEMSASTIFCENGDTFYCSLSAGEVITVLDTFDREKPLIQHFN